MGGRWGRIGVVLGLVIGDGCFGELMWLHSQKVLCGRLFVNKRVGANVGVLNCGVILGMLYAVLRRIERS